MRLYKGFVSILLTLAAVACSFFEIPFPLNNPVDPKLVYSYAWEQGQDPFSAGNGIPEPKGIAYHPDSNQLLVGSSWTGGSFWIDAGTGLLTETPSWDDSVNDIARDPVSGDIFVVLSSAVYRIAEPGGLFTEVIDEDDVTFYSCAVDLAQNIYLHCRDNLNDQEEIRQYAKNGNYIGGFPLDGFGVNSISVSDDYLFILDSYLGAIFLLDKNNGQALREIYWDSSFSQYRNINVTLLPFASGDMGSGELYYSYDDAILHCHSWGQFPIVRFDPANISSPLVFFGGSWADYESIDQNSIEVTATGEMYIVDARSGKIVTFPANTVVYENPALADTEAYEYRDLCIDSNDVLYLADSAGRRITVFDTRSQLFLPAISLANGPSTMWNIEQISTDSGFLFVTNGGTAKQLLTDGSYVAEWNEPGGYSFTDQILLGDGSILIADTYANNLFFGLPGGALDGPYWPSGGFYSSGLTPDTIFLDSGVNGEVYVAANGYDWASFGILDVASLTFTPLWESSQDPFMMQIRDNASDGGFQESMFRISGFAVFDSYSLWIVFYGLSAAVRFGLSGQPLGSLSLNEDFFIDSWSEGEIKNYSISGTSTNWEQNRRGVAVDSSGVLYVAFQNRIKAFAPR